MYADFSQEGRGDPPPRDITSAPTSLTINNQNLFSKKRKPTTRLRSGWFACHDVITCIYVCMYVQFICMCYFLIQGALLIKLNDNQSLQICVSSIVEKRFLVILGPSRKQCCSCHLSRKPFVMLVSFHKKSALNICKAFQEIFWNQNLVLVPLSSIHLLLK